MTLKLSRKTQKLLLATFIVLLAGLTGVDAADFDPINRWLEPIRPGYYQVLDANDGDTITIATTDGVEEVRLIGVDTPELYHPDKPVQCWAREASAFTASQVAGRQVQLVSDWKDDNRDLYGRLLRYVYLPDGTLLNEALITEGHGFAYTLYPFDKKQLFELREHEARTNRRGLWAGCQVDDSDLSPQTNPI